MGGLLSWHVAVKIHQKRKQNKYFLYGTKEVRQNGRVVQPFLKYVIKELLESRSPWFQGQ